MADVNPQTFIKSLQSHPSPQPNVEANQPGDVLKSTGETRHAAIRMDRTPQTGRHPHPSQATTPASDNQSPEIASNTRISCPQYCRMDAKAADTPCPFLPHISAHFLYQTPTPLRPQPKNQHRVPVSPIRQARRRHSTRFDTFVRFPTQPPDLAGQHHVPVSRTTLIPIELPGDCNPPCRPAPSLPASTATAPAVRSISAMTAAPDRRPDAAICHERRHRDQPYPPKFRTEKTISQLVSFRFLTNGHFPREIGSHVVFDTSIAAPDQASGPRSRLRWIA